MALIEHPSEEKMTAGLREHPGAFMSVLDGQLDGLESALRRVHDA